MKFFYRLYQLFIAIPIFLVYTIVLGTSCAVGSVIGNGHFWG